MVRLLAFAALLVGCGPSSSPSNDGSTQSCTSFDCSQLGGCSTISAAQCGGLCECFPSRWTSQAFADFASCASQCKSVGDTYSTCIVETSAAQPTFVNPQYISNCDAKRSVCPSYPTDACEPVNLALLSANSLDDLTSCLGLECGGPAEACVDDVLYCGSPP